jgi:hypothetical protein
MKNKLDNLENLSDEELSKRIDSLPQEERDLIKLMAMASLAQYEDTPKAFGAFFYLMNGTKLEQEQVRWVENAYLAHEQKKGVLQECFRESGKTIVFSLFGAFRIGKEPHKKNGLIRINDPKAKETTAKIADIIENNPKWKAVFPHVVPDKDRGWGAAGYYVKRTDMSPADWSSLLTQQPDGPTFVGHGIDSGSILGSHWNGWVIIDDVHDEENTSSERQLQMVKKKYRGTIAYCVMEDAWELWNFTPWLTNDLYAEMIASGTRIHSKTPVMTRCEEGEGEYWETESDIPISGKWYKLSSPRWGFERIAKKYRETTPVEFARMLLLDLEATKGLNLKDEWLHYYPGEQINQSWPVIMGIDYASTMDKIKDKDRDFFALSVFRVIPGGGIVLVDGRQAHYSKGEALDFVASYAALYPTLIKIGVESIGKGEEFYSDLVLINDNLGRALPLFPIPYHSKSKGRRFEDWLAPRFKISRIWVSNTPNDFISKFRNEWLSYPSKHDDCLDAVYMGALAAEGYIPSQAERTLTGYNKPKQTNPYESIGLVGRR